MSNPVGLQGYKTTICFATVEDINDPEQLNRVKCRIPQHGSKGQTPSDAIPWTKTLLTSGTNVGGGGGSGGLSIANGATVMVMVNEDNHEDMTVIGVLPVNSTGKADSHTGASAGGQSTMALGSLKDGLVGGKYEPATDMSKKILNPAPATHPQKKGKYPDTHVNVSKSGFRTTFHDVGGETYKAEIHPTGTFTEMQADGNYVTYTTKDRKEAIDGEYTLGSEKDMVITTHGNLQLKVKGNFLIECEGMINEYAAGDKSSDIGGDYTLSSAGRIDVIGKSEATYASKSTTYVTGSEVQLNDSGSKGHVSSFSQMSSKEIKDGIGKGKFVGKIKG